MKRSGFTTRRSAMRSRQAELKRRAMNTRRVRLNKHGKRARASARANRILKAECVRLGIFYCELGYEGCRRDDLLTHAHVAKRRELLPGELEHSAILACQVCHRVLDEGMSHAEMRATVEQKLSERKVRFYEPA